MDCKEKILSNDYRDLIVDYSVRINTDAGQDLCYTNLGNLFRMVYVNKMNVPPIMDVPREYQMIPKLFGLMPISGGAGGGQFDPAALTSSGITQVQRQPLNLTGRGVILVCIGSGIDYRSEAFKDELGETRIMSIWDQSIQEGTPPAGFLFGTEYTREEINSALQAEDPYSVVPTRDETGHGTTMMEVAAGSRLGSRGGFTGAAPEADIVVVKLKQCKQYLRDYYMLPQTVPAYAEQDIMLAVEYADSLYEKYDRPVVILLGLGTNRGSHSGTSPLGLYLNSVAIKRSRAVVVAGGDEGNAAHHFQGMLKRGTDSAYLGPNENYRDVEVRVGADNRGFLMELWGSTPDIYNVTVRTPGGENVTMQNLGVGKSITYNFIYERSEVTVSSILVEPVSGDELIIFRIQNPTEGIWNFRVSASGMVHNGVFHMWLPITQFLTSEAYFLEPDPYTTLTEPAMAINTIGVSTYNDQNNSFYIESGRGFSRTGQIRPDFAAPGVNVSALNGKKTGSSLAAAITAGGVAQFLQWSAVERNNEYLESKQVKNFFIRGASRSPDLVYPNREWGYGRLNVAGTFDVLAGL